MSKYLSNSNLISICQNVKNKFSHVVLYENDLTTYPSNVSTATLPITLTQSCLGFQTLYIEAICYEGQFVTVEVPYPYPGKQFNFDFLLANTSSVLFQYRNLRCQISSDGLKIEKYPGNYYGQWTIAGSSGQYDRNWMFAITRVWGIYNYHM